MLIFFRLILITAVLAIASCANTNAIKSGDTLYTISNLHPDPKRRVLYSLNYQLPGLIPVCAKIKVISIKRKRMVFDYMGVPHYYNLDKHTNKSGISLQANLLDYFGQECPSLDHPDITPLDKKGIAEGVAFIGMSKRGVLLAMGRPPRHATPNIDSNQWRYWRKRARRPMVVEFDGDGKVLSIGR